MLLQALLHYFQFRITYVFHNDSRASQLETRIGSLRSSSSADLEGQQRGSDSLALSSVEFFEMIATDEKTTAALRKLIT